MKIRTGDKVKVISGKSKGKEGLVSRVFTKNEMVLVDGANIATKHIKATKQKAGGMVKLERPIHISNVMLIEGDKVSRIGYKIVDGKKYRLAKKSGEVIKSTAKKGK
jgi:large subunit ribosomal protein L24